MTNGTGLGPLGQVYMTAHDLSRAVAFYRDSLGLPFLFEVPGMAFFDMDGIRLMLGKPESEEHDHPGSILYFRVDDIQASREELGARGVEFVHEPSLIAPMGDHDLWMAFFKDSEGNHLALMSEVPTG